MKLFELLPDEAYSGEIHVKDFQESIDAKVKEVQAARDDLYLQFRIGTATNFGLTKFEQEYGLLPNVAKTSESRRARIIAKKRGRGTATVKAIENVARSFTVDEVNINEIPGSYKFVVNVYSTFERLFSLDDMKASIEETKPAHLAYSLNIITEDTADSTSFCTAAVSTQYRYSDIIPALPIASEQTADSIEHGAIQALFTKQYEIGVA